MNWIWVTWISLLNLTVSQGEKPISNFQTKDTVLVELYASYDSLDVLDGYRATIATPICEADKCYMVTIDFHWDLLGRFDHYDTLPGEALTKLDHDPFESADYAKLDRILKNTRSPLSKYEKDELVQETRLSEVDGITGATRRDIKASVINGAVYSCYTLWHIANGTVKDSLQNVTKRNFSLSLVGKMVASKDQEINYFLIDQFSEEDCLQYQAQILSTLTEGKGYFPKNAIEKLPQSFFADSTTQHYFADRFADLNYFTQVALLQKLSTDALVKELADVLISNRDERPSLKNELIDGLIEEK